MIDPSGLLIRAAAAAQALVADVEAPELDDAQAHHLLRVRRLRAGEPVVISDGRGSWRMGTVAAGGLEPDGPVSFEARPEQLSSVALPPVKGDRSEWAVAKLTELGCDRIIALETERASVRWSAGSATRALDRWRRVAAEASCQSRRTWLPEIEGPRSLVDLAAAEEVVLAVPGGPSTTWPSPVVAIGPEGGWSEEELALSSHRVGLAAQVLRTETAAVAAGVLLGGLRGGTVGVVSQPGSGS